jgi:hypothetical protein
MSGDKESAKVVLGFGREFDLALAELTTRGFIALFLVSAVAIVLIFKDGTSARTLLLLGGSIISAIGIFGFSWLIIQKVDMGGAKPSIKLMLSSLGGLAPYVFGCYLTFYEGLWRGVGLFSNFTLGALLAFLFYLIAGYAIVLSIYRLTHCCPTKFTKKRPENQADLIQ